jgi:tetratricopeptide (TPR) repeat protein
MWRRAGGWLAALALLAVLCVWLKPFSRPSIQTVEERRLAANAAAQQAHRLGERAFAGGNYADAVRGFSTAARLEPRSALALLNCSMAQSRAGKRAEALQSIEAALALQPNWGLAWVRAAHLYADENRLEDAKRAAARAAALAPELPEAWVAEAHVALRRGELGESERFARRATTLDPRSAPAWLALGEALLRTPGGKELPAAIRAFEQANSLEPSFFSHRLLGEALRQAGQPEPAIASLQSAFQLDSHDAGTALELAGALRTVGRVEEAERWADRARRLQEERYRVTKLSRAAEQDPGNVTVQLALAQALRLQGDLAGCERAYRRVLVVEPENEAARKALAALEAGVAP